MARQRFFVGVGAQRSGTTWLAHALRSSADVRFSPLKEICFFDSAAFPERRQWTLGRRQTKLATLGIGRYALSHPVSGVILAYHYLGMRRLRTSSYRAYFDELARRGAVAGEISPSYAMLDVESIGRMDQLLDRPNYFYVMRNPADRLLSQLSFRKHRRGVAPLIHGRDLDETIDILTVDNPYSAYEHTLSRYLSTVDPERFHVMFFETLFDPETCQRECDRLCDFLGVSRVRAALERDVNRAPGIVVPPDVRHKLVNRLRAEYQAAHARHGDALPSSWLHDVLQLDGHAARCKTVSIPPIVR